MKKVREGYKMTDLGEIPIDWVVGKLGDLSEIVRGASPRPKGDPKYYGGSVPRLMISDVTRDGKYVTPKTDFLTEEGAKKSRPMNKGDLVMSISGTVALPSFLAVDSCIHDGFMGFKKIDEQLYKDYLYYEILHLREKLINSATDGGVYINLTTDIVKNFDILVPLMKEQQKISLILSSVDEQIEITDNLIEKTKELKKGLMQKLLTKGIGHSRFKDTEIGRIPEEWEIRDLREIVQICYGKSQKEVEVEDGKYEILGTGGVIGRTNEFLWNEPSVLIGRKGTIDKPQYIEEPFWTVDTLFYTKLQEGYFAKWLFYYLSSIDLKKYNEATGVPSLSVSVLNNIKIVTPSFKEQKEIALIISSVDEQIEQYESKKEKLQELKKGLMQKLLTGSIRVKV